MNTVLQVAKAIFPVLIAVLAAAINSALAIIVGVVSVIFTTFRSLTTEIDIDPDSNNEYVKGVIGANASFTRDQFPVMWGEYTLKSESAIRTVVGPFELFT